MPIEGCVLQPCEARTPGPATTSTNGPGNDSNKNRSYPFPASVSLYVLDVRLLHGLIPPFRFEGCIRSRDKNEESPFGWAEEVVAEGSCAVEHFRRRLGLWLLGRSP